MSSTPITRPERFFHDRPVIGILNQPWNFNTLYTGNHVQASYIKFVEMGGGIPVVVDFTNQTEEEIREAMQDLNGIIIPGGDVKLQNEDKSPTEFTEKCRVVYDEAKAINDRGLYFPVWGVCMGLQLIAAWEDVDAMKYGYFDDYNRPTPIKLAENWKELRSLQHLTPEQVKWMEDNDSTFESHRDGIPLENWVNSKALSENYHIAGTSVCRKGHEYVAMAEHKTYPFYAFQFHPEKHTTNFLVNAPCTSEVRAINQAWANFLADECKYNPTQMEWEKVDKLMFSNFTLRRTQDKHQCCYFM